MTKLKYFIPFILILLLGLAKSETVTELTLGEPLKDSTKDKIKEFKISNIPTTNKYIKIQTKPKFFDQLITFVVNNIATPQPSYKNSIIQAESSHINTVIIPLTGTKPTSLQIKVSSPIDMTEFTITPTAVKDFILELGEEITTMTNSKDSAYYLNIPQERSNRLLIYAIGSNLNDFTIHYTQGEAKVKFDPEFRTGYQSILDTSTVYDSLLLLTVTTVDVMNLKLGVKELVTLDEDFPMMKQTYELFSQRKCYKMKELISEKTIIMNIDANIKLKVVLRGTNEQQIRDYSLEMLDSIKVVLSPDVKKLCIEDANPDDTSASLDSYVFQAFDYDQIEEYQQFIMPVFNGFQTKYLIPNGKTIALRRKGFYTYATSAIEVQMYTIQGNAILYSHICEEYPCFYDDVRLQTTEIKKALIKGKMVSNTTFITQSKTKEVKYTSPTKALAIVTCPTSTEGKDCIVYLTMNDDYEVFNLLPQSEIHHSIYANTGKVFNYQSYDPSVTSVSFIINVYSGDVSFEVKNQMGLIGKEMMIGNRKVIAFEGKAEEILFKNFEIITYGNDYSYYSINVLPGDKQEYTRINPAQTLLQSVTKASPLKKFIVKSRNDKDDSPFIISLHPLNCPIKYTMNGQVETITSHKQLTIDSIPDANREVSINVDYVKNDIETTKDDVMCLFYITGTEAESPNGLMVNEGIQHQMTLLPKKISKMKYVYPMSYSGVLDEQMIIDIDYIEDRSINLDVRITIIPSSQTEENYDNVDTIVITQPKSIIYTKGLVQYCKINEQCNAFITISPQTAIATEFKYTITVRSLRRTPVFLKKNKIQKDHVTRDYAQYYYTDIGQDEEGMITFDQSKDEVRIFARIIPKDLKENALLLYNNIILPYKDMDQALLLPFDSTTKVTAYTKEHTSQCGKGCYLYITVVSVLHDEPLKTSSTTSPVVIDYKILVHPRNTQIEVKLNEYINNLLTSKTDSHLYSFIVPYNTNQISLHFFSDFGRVSIWKGEAITGDPLFKITNSKDVLLIHKNDIDQSLPSLKDIHFLIKIEASFIIKQGSEYSLEINASYDENKPVLNYLSDDQNEICVWTSASNVCYLVRLVEAEPITNDTKPLPSFHIAVDPISNPKNSFIIYARYIRESEAVDGLTKQHLPTETKYDVSSKDQYDRNVLSLSPDLKEKYYIVISVYANQIGKGLVTSTSVIEGKVIQLYHDVKVMLSMNKSEMKHHFKMNGSSKYLVTIDIITGQGKLFITKSKEEALPIKETMMIEMDDATEKDHQFYIESSTSELLYSVSYIGIDTSVKKPLRQVVLGSDSKIISDKSTNIDTSYYFKLDDSLRSSNANAMNIMISFRFSKYVCDTRIKESNEDFELKAYMTDEEFILNKLNADSDATPPESNIIKGGYYSHFTHKGGITFSMEKLKSPNDYIYFEIAKGKSNTNDYIMLQANVITYLYGDSLSGMVLPIDKYNHFTMEENILSNVFLLKKKSISDNKMLVELSSCEKEALKYSIKSLDNTNAESAEITFQESTSGKSLIEITLPEKIEGVQFIIEPSKSQHSPLKYLLKYSLKDKSSNDKYTPSNNDVTTTNNHTISDNGLTTSWQSLADLKEKTVKYIIQVTPLQDSTAFEKQCSPICNIEYSSNSLWEMFLHYSYTTESVSIGNTISIGKKDLLEDKKSYSVSVTAIVSNDSEEMIYRYDNSQFQYEYKNMWLVYIVIIVIASILIVGFLIALVYYMCKRKNISSSELTEQINNISSQAIENNGDKH